MGSERITIPRQEMSEIITSTAESEKDLSETEKGIIEEIVNTAPEDFRGITLTRWCENRVSKILESHPELGHEAENIRRTVTFELRYKLREEDFKLLKAIIDRERPDEVTPSYFKDKGYEYINKYVRKFFRDAENKPYWKFITDKLGITDIFNPQEQEEWPDDKIISSLKYLRSKYTDKISPRIIENENRKLYIAIKSRFQANISNKTQWEEWAKKAEIDNIFEYEWSDLNLETAGKETLAMLVKQEPLFWGPTWVERLLPHVQNFIVDHIRTPGSEGPNWKVLLDILPPYWRKKWKYQGTESRKSALEDRTNLTQRLVHQLERINPATWNEEWIIKHATSIYRDIIYRAENEEERQKVLQTIVEEMGEHWSSKWRPDISNQSEESQTIYYNEEEVENLLADKLDELYKFVDEPKSLEVQQMALILIKAAQKGNMAAKEKLLEYTSLAIDSLTPDQKMKNKLNIYSPTSSTKIEDCIDNYTSAEGKFLDYVNYSLLN